MADALSQQSIERAPITRSSVNPKVGATPGAASGSPSTMPIPGASAPRPRFREARRSLRPWLSRSASLTSSKAPAATSASTPSLSTRASAALMRTAMAARSSRSSRPCKTSSARTVPRPAGHPKRVLDHQDGQSGSQIEMRSWAATQRLTSTRMGKAPGLTRTYRAFMLCS